VIRDLVNWLIEAFADDSTAWTDATVRNLLVRQCARGEDPVDLPPRATELVRPIAPVAVVVNDFYSRLYRVSRSGPFPSETCGGRWLRASLHPVDAPGRRARPRNMARKGVCQLRPSRRVLQQLGPALACGV
jgi:hypothetical protein